MSDAIISIRMSDPLLRDASLHAERTGVSLENWLLSLAAERIRDEHVAERFFHRESQASDGRRMREILNAANDNPVHPGDELES